MSEQVTANRRRSRAIVATFVAVAVAGALLVGWLLPGGVLPLVVTVAAALALSAAAYARADAVALRLCRARPAPEADHARYHNLVEGLCIASGLPKPRLYVVDDPAPNAFAVGHNPRNAAVGVTTGLLRTLNRMELEGVLAHQLAHVRNHDILVSTVAVTMVGTVMVPADLALRTLWWGMGRTTRADFDRRHGRAGGPRLVLGVPGLALLALAPLVARLLRVALGPERETLADLAAVELTRYPPGLVSALEKLGEDSTVTHAAGHATAHLWIAEPAAQSPEEGRLPGLNNRFRVHPPLEDRIALLREM